jgi:FAD/FMN-containing dehydrogenase/Fe-S oxidoreductase
MPSLPQLDPPSAANTSAEIDPLAHELSRVVRGAVRFSLHDRMLYSTDASIYQVTPLGVVTPIDANDVRSLLKFCDETRVPVLPRGGGTSLAGQCTNRAVVVDLSPHFRKMDQLDVAAKTCVVEPGIGVDELNRLLAAQNTGLFFAPDPATAAHCAIGGCIGNNAAGSRSIQYGRTSENLAAVEVVLPGGETCWLEAGAGRKSDVALRLARGVAAICRKYADLIRARFPKTIRRNAGYGLDLVIQQIDRGVADEDLDLSGLMCGSEGTLAVTVRAKLKLHPIPKTRGLAILSFATLEDAMDAVVPIVGTGPSAVELLDDVVLEAARGNNECKKYLELVPPVDGKKPAALLYVEYATTGDRTAIEAKFAELKRVPLSVAYSQATYFDTTPMAKLWNLRKAGEPLLHGLPGKRKPHTFVEDNAVPVENLARFVREFKAIVAKHGTVAAYYAHASVGVLHVRPMIDLHDDEDRVRMRAIAVDVADLARECGGVMSGEHGDGRVRGPLLERYFGAELMEAFRETKRVFDPNGILNPNMVVDVGPIESITDHLRTDEVTKGADADAIDTYYDYEDQHGFRGAAELCNGAGVCRKTSGGAMCPSYRGTLDERHATRGRGNALRLAISGQFAKENLQPNWNDAATLETLDLCLSCKACKSECPSNVDIARLKAEYVAQSYRATGHVPLKARVFGHVRTLNKLGSITPGIANFVNKLPPVRWVLNRVLNLAPQRSMPLFGRSLYKWFKQHKPRVAPATRSNLPPRDEPVAPFGKYQPTVVLYADCFATYNEPHVGQAAVKVLEAFGYRVAMPQVGCCGRAMMSTGLLGDCIDEADRVIAQLMPYVGDPNVVAIVACEPSCVSSFTDDWLQLKLKTPIEQRRKLASRVMLVEHFLEKFWDYHPTHPTMATADAAPVILHGHCHQKALWGDITSSALLNRLTNGKVTTLASGCCGMAGSFGYDAKKYDLSMKIGELSVFPPIRAAAADTTICAPGTSCRHQIHDGTGRHALHPIELAAKLMGL